MESSMSSLNIRCLEAFSQIMLTGSATAAAKHLGMTQPGISRLLAQFEAHIGFSLFYRDKGRLIATDEAYSLVSEVDVLLSNIERVTTLARNMKEATSGTLKIVAPNSFIAGPLANVVTAFLQMYPKVNICLESHNPQQALEQIALRSVDCGFIPLPEAFPGLAITQLITSDAVCAVSHEHPLAQQDAISLSQLAQYELILLGRGRRSRNAIESAFRQKQLTMKVKIDANTVATACTFAKRGHGVAIVNKLLAEQYVDEQLTLVPLESNLRYEYGFATSSHAPMNRLTRRFHDFCCDYFQPATCRHHEVKQS